MRMRDENFHQALLEAGKAWSRVKEAEKWAWHDWTMEIGPGLMKARAEAMRVARTNNPIGRGYNTVMSALLREYKLDDMHETERAHILKVMENLAAVEEWRSKLPNPSDLNHPSRVWVKYQHALKRSEDDEGDEGEVEKSKSRGIGDAFVEALEQTRTLHEGIKQLKARVQELEEALRIARGIEAPKTKSTLDWAEADRELEESVRSALEAPETKDALDQTEQVGESKPRAKPDWAELAAARANAAAEANPEEWAGLNEDQRALKAFELFGEEAKREADQE